jgi:16S rRNA (adenine1518-N6/adenine1519-N6)-dimethyltransferase
MKTPAPPEPRPGAGGQGARATLARFGLRPKKSWGQNFLEDRGVCARIAAAAGIGHDDVVVEIGPGLGALTRALLAAGPARVIAVERDPDMVAVLNAELGGERALAVSAADALGFDLAAAAAAAGRPLLVVGNLPYQITSPLLFRIIGAAAGGAVVRRGLFMVQRELAERIVSGPGSKSYGRLSVMVQQAAEVRVLFHVGSHAFFPRPAVTSTVFSLEPRPRPLAPVRDAALFAAVVRAGFGGRRKMLRRALGDAFGEPAVTTALAAAGIAGTRRAEELSVAELARLADALHAAGVAAPAGAVAAKIDELDEDDHA